MRFDLEHEIQASPLYLGTQPLDTLYDELSWLDPFQPEIQPAGLKPSEVEQFIYKCRQPVDLSDHTPQKIARHRWIVNRPGLECLNQSPDRSQRRPQLMRYVSDEFTANGFESPQFGDIAKNHNTEFFACSFDRL